MINLEEFWKHTPNSVIQALAVGLVCVGVGGGVLIGQSSNLKVDKEGIAIERQAVENQNQLENSLTLIELQQVRIGQLEDKLKGLSKKNAIPSDLVQDVENVKDFIPQSKVEKLKITVEESKSVLHGDSSDELYKNTEDNRS